jgi:predicted AlkP superfamily pyrophosphatase or phosphodiesterase
MKANKLSLFIFVDALGWEVLKSHPDFLSNLIVDRKRLRSIFGYSSACDPAIISGRMPSENGHWSSFYYSPATCPYGWVKYFSYLPKVVTNYHRVRHKLSDLIAYVHGYTGYFQIYNVPFEYLPYFDYAEKKWMWNPLGLIQGESIIDKLSKSDISYYAKGPDTSEEEQLEELDQHIKKQDISYAYVMLGKLDAVMHSFGTEHYAVDKQLKEYDKLIKDIILTANQYYEEVSWYVFSDHGMHNVKEVVDLQSIIQALSLEYGKDYIAMYDSTMARFWYLNDRAMNTIHEALSHLRQGRFLSDQELIDMGVFFPNHMYGDEIFLVNSHVLIIPSYMGLKPIAGMHGYHPDDAETYAAICSNKKIPAETKGIQDIFHIMVNETIG